ncbi:hypothetical protein GE09DRAFT_166568 [Coniochaeta sp. 2T2.1]|nr:hypothetical protein GE09DRAFT_166568 [Coniochaeta sp. 2T2.1]
MSSASTLLYLSHTFLVVSYIYTNLQICFVSSAPRPLHTATRADHTTGVSPSYNQHGAANDLAYTIPNRSPTAAPLGITAAGPIAPQGFPQGFPQGTNLRPGAQMGSPSLEHLSLHPAINVNHTTGGIAHHPPPGTAGDLAYITPDSEVDCLYRHATGRNHIIQNDPRRRYRLHQGSVDLLSASDRYFVQIHFLVWQGEAAGSQLLDSVEEQHVYAQTVDLRNNSNAVFGLSAPVSVSVSVRSKTCN